VRDEPAAAVQTALRDARPAAEVIRRPAAPSATLYGVVGPCSLRGERP
jgi:hypothetical protein